MIFISERDLSLMTNTLFDDCVIIVFGLILGSFTTALYYRTKHKQSWIFDRQKNKPSRSQCPVCHHPLGVFDLIPVVSWVFLKGRCRYCQHKIPILYPVLEIISAITFYLFYCLLGFSWLLLVVYILQPFVWVYFLMIILSKADKI